MVTATFPPLRPTLMLVYTPTEEEIPVVGEIVRAGAGHVGSGRFGYGLEIL